MVAECRERRPWLSVTRLEARTLYSLQRKPHNGPARDACWRDAAATSQGTPGQGAETLGWFDTLTYGHAEADRRGVQYRGGRAGKAARAGHRTGCGRGHPSR